MSGTNQTDVQIYWSTHVIPALIAWRNSDIDLQLAMSAVVNLYHVADHYWHSYEHLNPSVVLAANSPGVFRRELALTNQDFSVLRDVAEAHKHLKLDRPQRILTNSNQTDVGATGFGEAPFGEGPWGGGPSIIIELDNGEKRHLSGVIDGVESLWLSMQGLP